MPVKPSRRTVLAGLAAGFLPAPMFAGDRGLKGYLRTNWSSDPWTYGSYSYLAKGSDQSDRHRLAEPVDDRLFFAGEAVHPTRNSTVHAAFESGLIAADQVRRSLDHGRVVVIGAGVAGLSTAQQLSEDGFDVVVLEARDRVGVQGLWQLAG